MLAGLMIAGFVVALAVVAADLHRRRAALDAEKFLLHYEIEEEEEEEEVNETDKRVNEVDELVDRTISTIYQKPANMITWGDWKSDLGGNDRYIEFGCRETGCTVMVKATGDLWLRTLNSGADKAILYAAPIDPEQRTRLSEAYCWLKANLALESLSQYEQKKEQEAEAKERTRYSTTIYKDLLEAALFSYREDLNFKIKHIQAGQVLGSLPDDEENLKFYNWELKKIEEALAEL